MPADDERITAEDPDAEPEEEEEDEEDLVDPIDAITEQCNVQKEAEHLKSRYDACNERVEGAPDTEEKCTEELFDFLHVVSECVSKQIFKHLK